MRVLLAGILGGIAMFIWSSIAHVALPLGMVGVRDLPDEQPVLNAMQASLGESNGFYLYPGFGLGPNASREERDAAMKQYDQKLAANPSGILIYHPPGAKGITVGKLGIEFVTEMMECLLLAFLLSMARLGSFGARLGFAILVGVIAAVTTNLPYWNWYGFPSAYTSAYMFTELMAYLVAGLVIAAMLRRRIHAGFAPPA